MRAGTVLAGFFVVVMAGCVPAVTPSLPTSSGATTPPVQSPLSTTAAPAGVPVGSASPDFDGDGAADLAVATITSGSVDDEVYGIRVWYGSGAIADPTSTPVDGPLLAADFNSDGFSDLAMSAGMGNVVRILLGSPAGLRADASESISVPTNGGYIASMAVVPRPVPRLAVGVTKYQGRGQVFLYKLGSGGVEQQNALVLEAGTGALSGLSDPDGTFGQGLAASDSSLFAGVPGATVGGRARAGAVVMVELAPDAVTRATIITQDSRGVGGAVARGRGFGAALASRDGYLVTSSDAYGDGASRDSGTVTVFTIAEGKLAPIRQIDQATAGVPGRAEPGDRFGSALALGSICPGVTSVVVGGSGERVGQWWHEAGSVWVIPLANDPACAAIQLYEGHGLGTVATNNVGQMVAVLGDNTGDDIVVAAYGSYSEGPSGQLIRWSHRTRAPVLRFDQLLAGIAGR